MWPMPPISSHYITVNFAPHHISCCWFIQDEKKIILKAFKTASLDNLELERLIIFNPSIIRTFIASFLEKNRLQNPSALFSLNGPSIKEQFISLDNALLTPERFFSVDRPKESEDKQWKKLIWDSIYLYPTQDGKFTFYIAGITRELLFQYQLLALRNNLNLIAITPEATAQLCLYKHSKGAQFRHSQLGIDLSENNNQVSQIIDETFFYKNVIPAPGIIVNENNTDALLTSLGLFLMRNKTECEL